VHLHQVFKQTTGKLLLAFRLNIHAKNDLIETHRIRCSTLETQNLKPKNSNRDKEIKIQQLEATIQIIENDSEQKISELQLEIKNLKEKYTLECDELRGKIQTLKQTGHQTKMTEH